MKRTLLAALFLVATGATAVTHAACDGPGVAAGDHGEATVTFTEGGRTVNIHTSAFGNFVVGPAQACADGSAGLAPTTGFVRIKVDGETVCHNTNKAPLFDPFIFGGGVHDELTDPCGADMSWDGLQWLITPGLPPGPPDPPAVGADATGAHAGNEQPAIVRGVYWFDEVVPDETAPGGFATVRRDFTVPENTVGWFSNHGAEAALYS